MCIYMYTLPPTKQKHTAISRLAAHGDSRRKHAGPVVATSSRGKTTSDVIGVGEQ